jgi:UMF1 family MFS transporter
LRRTTLFFWALYDLANTSFSLGIVSLYYPLWIHKLSGGRDSPYAFTATAVSIAVLLTAPLLGRLSDHFPYPKRFLILFTFLCILPTPFLGSESVAVSLFLFGFAYYSYQISLIYYDSLLGRIATERERVRVGGVGVGMGYVGSLLIIGLGRIVFSEEDSQSFSRMFEVIALIFLFFSLPLFFGVQDRREIHQGERASNSLFIRFDEILFPPLLKESPLLRRFFLMRVLYAEAVNTVILFLGIYASAEGGMSGEEIHTLLFYSILSAILGGFFWGEVAQRITPSRALRYVLVLWIFALGIVAGSAHTSWAKPALFLAGIMIGLGLSGVHACDRPWLFHLIPKSRSGEAFGIYAVSGRVGAILGPALYGLISDGLGRPAGVLVLAILVALSLPVAFSLPDREETQRGTSYL